MVPVPVASYIMIYMVEVLGRNVKKIERIELKTIEPHFGRDVGNKYK
jgi:hypothetical protein